MTWFVTGAAGFLGAHLVRTLHADGMPVVAGVRDPGRRCWGADVRTVAFDVTRDAEALAGALAEARPDVVAHLAAQSFPQKSWEDPAGTMRVNALGTLTLMEAVRRACPGARVLVLGSSAEYAPSADGAPLAEDARCAPLTPYGASKLAATTGARLLGARHGIHVAVVRPFFVIGPGKEGDVCSDLARRVVAIERGGEPVLRVGRTDVVRDFLHVADAVAAIRRIAAPDAPAGIFNVCSGVGWSIGDVVAEYRAHSRRLFDVVEDPALVRPVDERVKVGDAAALRALGGWAPGVRIHDALREILESWRAKEAA